MGFAVGDSLGVAVGLAVGDLLAVAVGLAVGFAVGDSLGVAEGIDVGDLLGFAVLGSRYTRTHPLPIAGAPTANDLPSPERETEVPKFSLQTSPLISLPR